VAEIRAEVDSRITWIGEKEKIMQHNHTMPTHHDTTIKDYLLFAGIILAILIGAVGLTYSGENQSLVEGMRWFEGLFFLVFALFKLSRYRDFIDAFRGYDIVAKRSEAYAKAYPFIELILAAGFLFNVALPAVLVITLTIMAVSSIGVIKELRRGSHITCACLGTVIKLPLTQVTLTEDVVMGAMAAYMLVAL